MEFKHKHAVVTGGSSGIGAAIVQKFVEEGAFIHVLDVVIPAANPSSQVAYHECNIAQQAAVQEIIDQIITRHPLHILVNNAGIAYVGKLEDTSEADMDRLYSVNIKGVYNCLYAVIPHFKQQGGGVILNIASVAGSVGIAGRFAYSMTKGAVLAMTYSVAKDYLQANIRCNAISPARIHTPFVDGFIAKHYPGQEQDMLAQLAASQPIGRMGTPEEVAHLAVFLCSDKASFITGTDYPIDGGFIKLNS